LTEEGESEGELPETEGEGSGLGDT
jgi:hypothetical protein